VSGRAEPRFDIDYAWGREAECQIEQLLRWIANGDPTVEVKRKSVLDLYFYIETHCDKGRRGEYVPSGISVTTAKAWGFVIGDTGLSVFFPTDSLRMMLDDASTRDKEETHGSCPTKGKLVSLAVLLYREKKRLAAITAVPPLPAQTKSKQEPEAKPQTRIERELLDTDINW